jgi:hypothetical protein
LTTILNQGYIVLQCSPLFKGSADGMSQQEQASPSFYACAMAKRPAQAIVTCHVELKSTVLTQF